MNFEYASTDVQELETFPNPFPAGHSGMIHIEAPEFTSLCPKTGLPDFANIVVDYIPNKLCLESKSYKLYLVSFRQHGAFHEACVTRIYTDLKKLLDPVYLKVEGRFSPRGGISFWPTLESTAENTLENHPVEFRPDGVYTVDPGADPERIVLTGDDDAEADGIRKEV